MESAGQGSPIEIQPLIGSQYSIPLQNNPSSGQDPSFGMCTQVPVAGLHDRRTTYAVITGNGCIHAAACRLAGISGAEVGIIAGNGGIHAAACRVTGIGGAEAGVIAGNGGSNAYITYTSIIFRACIVVGAGLCAAGRCIDALTGCRIAAVDGVGIAIVTVDRCIHTAGCRVAGVCGAEVGVITGNGGIHAAACRVAGISGAAGMPSSADKVPLPLHRSAGGTGIVRGASIAVIAGAGVGGIHTNVINTFLVVQMLPSSRSAGSQVGGTPWVRARVLVPN